MTDSARSSAPQNAATNSMLPFKLNPGDTISSCSGLWHVCDRISEELGRCHVCGLGTFRVVTVTSAEKLERRTALCGRHFIIATRQFPELKVLGHVPGEEKSHPSEESGKTG